MGETTESDTDVAIDDDFDVTSMPGEDEGDLRVTDLNKKVVMEPKDITIFQYKKWYEQGRLNLNPDWQRAYIWRGKRPSLLERVLN